MVLGPIHHFFILPGGAKLCTRLTQLLPTSKTLTRHWSLLTLPLLLLLPIPTTFSAAPRALRLVAASVVWTASSLAKRSQKKIKTIKKKYTHQGRHRFKMLSLLPPRMLVILKIQQPQQWQFYLEPMSLSAR
jgi:hypothetical protein